MRYFFPRNWLCRSNYLSDCARLSLIPVYLWNCGESDRVRDFLQKTLVTLDFKQVIITFID